MPETRLSLPPEQLLDDDTVRAALVAWSAADEQHREAAAARVEAEHVELPAALEADRAADVEALEGGKALPSQEAHEAKARQHIEGWPAASRRPRPSRRRPTTRCWPRSRRASRDSPSKPAASEQGSRRVEQTLAALDAATSKLAAARALVAWSKTPTGAFKVRGP